MLWKTEESTQNVKYNNLIVMTNCKFSGHYAVALRELCDATVKITSETPRENFTAFHHCETERLVTNRFYPGLKIFSQSPNGWCVQ